MKERDKRTMAEMLEDWNMDYAVRDRFKSERHPTRMVDGDDADDYYESLLDAMRLGTEG